MGNFLDTTNIDGRFDFSEWVRGYGKYLDEQLEVYKGLNFYPVSCLPDKDPASLNIDSWQFLTVDADALRISLTAGPQEESVTCCAKKHL